MLAAAGLYGATAYMVAQRRPELAIRVALGATSGSVVRLVLTRIGVLVAMGIVAGGILTFWGGRYIRTLLYEVQPGDPLTIVAAVSSIVAFTAVAAWLPAHAAGRSDPAELLRRV